MCGVCLVVSTIQFARSHNGKLQLISSQRFAMTATYDSQNSKAMQLPKIQNNVFRDFIWSKRTELMTMLWFRHERPKFHWTSFQKQLAMWTSCSRFRSISSDLIFATTVQEESCSAQHVSISQNFIYIKSHSCVRKVLKCWRNVNSLLCVQMKFYSIEVRVNTYCWKHQRKSKSRTSKKHCLGRIPHKTPKFRYTVWLERLSCDSSFLLLQFFKCAIFKRHNYRDPRAEQLAKIEHIVFFEDFAGANALNGWHRQWTKKTYQHNV